MPGMIGIVSYLVQWLALNQVGVFNQQQREGGGGYAYNNPYQSYPRKSHWTLLAEFQALPEAEIEQFLPQICNMVLERDLLNDDSLFEYFERILIGKCEECLPFGVRMCCYLKAAATAPSEGLFRNWISLGGNSDRQGYASGSAASAQSKNNGYIGPGDAQYSPAFGAAATSPVYGTAGLQGYNAYADPQQHQQQHQQQQSMQQRREDRLRALQDRVAYATAHGLHSHHHTTQQPHPSAHSSASAAPNPQSQSSSSLGGIDEKETSPWKRGSGINGDKDAGLSHEEKAELRSEYFQDFTYLLDSLSRIGIELKSAPVPQRNAQLRLALEQFNSLLFNRMHAQRSITSLLRATSLFEQQQQQHQHYHHSISYPHQEHPQYHQQLLQQGSFHHGQNPDVRYPAAIGYPSDPAEPYPPSSHHQQGQDYQQQDAPISPQTEHSSAREFPQTGAVGGEGTKHFSHGSGGEHLLAHPHERADYSHVLTSVHNPVHGSQRRVTGFSGGDPHDNPETIHHLNHHDYHTEPPPRQRPRQRREKVLLPLSAEDIAVLCPDAADFSLHIPLQQSEESIARLLRFVESECEVLPSKERCPYLVVVEVLEQVGYQCQSEELYTHHRLHRSSTTDSSSSSSSSGRSGSGSGSFGSRTSGNEHGKSHTVSREVSLSNISAPSKPLNGEAERIEDVREGAAAVGTAHTPPYTGPERTTTTTAAGVSVDQLAAESLAEEHRRKRFGIRSHSHEGSVPSTKFPVGIDQFGGILEYLEDDFPESMGPWTDKAQKNDHAQDTNEVRDGTKKVYSFSGGSTTARAVRPEAHEPNQALPSSASSSSSAHTTISHFHHQHRGQQQSQKQPEHHQQHPPHQNHQQEQQQPQPQQHHHLGGSVFPHTHHIMREDKTARKKTAAFGKIAHAVPPTPPVPTALATAVGQLGYGEQESEIQAEKEIDHDSESSSRGSSLLIEPEDVRRGDDTGGDKEQEHEQGYEQGHEQEQEYWNRHSTDVKEGKRGLKTPPAARSAADDIDLPMKGSGINMAVGGSQQGAGESTGSSTALPESTTEDAQQRGEQVENKLVGEVFSDPSHRLPPRVGDLAETAAYSTSSSNLSKDSSSKAGGSKHFHASSSGIASRAATAAAVSASGSVTAGIAVPPPPSPASTSSKNPSTSSKTPSTLQQEAPFGPLSPPYASLSSSSSSSFSDPPLANAAAPAPAPAAASVFDSAIASSSSRTDFVEIDLIPGSSPDTTGAESDPRLRTDMDTDRDTDSDTHIDTDADGSRDMDQSGKQDKSRGDGSHIALPKNVDLSTAPDRLSSVGAGAQPARSSSSSPLMENTLPASSPSLTSSHATSFTSADIHRDLTHRNENDASSSTSTSSTKTSSSSSLNIGIENMYIDSNNIHGREQHPDYPLPASPAGSSPYSTANDDGYGEYGEYDGYGGGYGNPMRMHGTNGGGPTAITGAGAGRVPVTDFAVADQRVVVRKKTWEERKNLVRQMSPFGHLPGWNLKSFIVKSGDDLKKEMLAMQIVSYCQHIFQSEGLDIFLRPYQIMATGFQSGLVEFVEGAQSIDSIKKGAPFRPFNLKHHFDMTFGPSFGFVHARAVENFVRSLVGYSLVTYLLQVKDRHNGNLLLDADGHIIHIDYGFILGDSPGFNINFESAPFKLTKEYVELMGGLDSHAFRTFEDLFLKGFLALQKHVEGLSSIVQLFYTSGTANRRKSAAAEALRARLLFPGSFDEVTSLIRESFDNWRTKQYDWFQLKTNNIQT